MWGNPETIFAVIITCVCFVLYIRRLKKQLLKEYAGKIAEAKLTEAEYTDLINDCRKKTQEMEYMRGFYEREHEKYSRLLNAGTADSADKAETAERKPQEENRISDRIKKLTVEYQTLQLKHQYISEELQKGEFVKYELSSAIANMTAEIEDLKRQRETAINENARISEELEREKSELSQKRQVVSEELQRLKYQIAEVNEKSQVLNDEIYTLEQEKSRIVIEIQNIKIEKDDTETELNKIKKEKEKLIIFLGNFDIRKNERIDNTETAWNYIIDSGTLPQNAVLKQKQKAKFYISAFLRQKSCDGYCIYQSEPFGDARDARNFGESLEKIAPVSWRVRETETEGEYIVYIENVPEECFEEFYRPEIAGYEFLNPNYAITHQDITVK